MSENTAASQETNAPVKKARKSSAKRYTVKDLAAEVAKSKGIDTFTAGKIVRSRLRANFAEVVKRDPTVKKAKSAANDGNRWPSLNGKVRDLVINGKGAQKPRKRS